ncbi:MAG: hypothetical protein DRP66_03705 [Planctomycetota bacterium]|nr:MAG: hypothetical protein DRP66_03705 [Planctomycetota bacterium]
MKQYVTPVIVNSDNTCYALERISRHDKVYNEAWIQQICYDKPAILPIAEIEPACEGAIPICMELSTDSGPCDLLYINQRGLITIAECKLWRNPEARRKAVGQILDYAKDIARWDYDKFQSECLRARKTGDVSLYATMKGYYPDLEESEFIDSVQRNLKKGRFLLLIIGDGIRENMEDLVKYVQSNGNLNFTLSLIELPVYRNIHSDQLVITPRVPVKTKEIERTVFRIVDSTADVELPTVEPHAKSKTLSEKDFYERLARSCGSDISEGLKTFLDELSESVPVITKVGRGNRLSLNIKSANGPYNFASIQEDGQVWFYGIVEKTDQIGNREIGVDYLKQLAIIVAGEFDSSYKPWFWCVRKNGKYMQISEYLAEKSAWKDLIENTLAKIEMCEEG